MNDERTAEQPTIREGDHDRAVRHDDDRAVRRDDGRAHDDVRDVDGVAPLRGHEITELRRRLDEPADGGGGSRFAWFLIGFVAALATIAVAAVVFLAVSDQDDDGRVELDVPAVDVGS